MRYSIILPALFAATSLAAPAVKYVTDVKVVHVTVTAGTPQATQAAAYPVAAAPAPAAAKPAASKPQQKHHKGGYKHSHTKKPAAPVVKTVYQGAPQPAQTYAPAPAPQPTSEAPVAAPVETYKPAPAPQPATTKEVTPAPTTPASNENDNSVSNGNIPKSNGESVLDIYNKYRRRYGMKDATWSQKLADNALLTGQKGEGHRQEHILPTLTKAGSCAQVITPGSDETMDGYGDYAPFDIAMLSWLCEVSTDSEISSECPKAMKANGMTYVDTAHHDDLVNPEYGQVGIAYYANPSPSEDTPWKGLWVASLET